MLERNHRGDQDVRAVEHAFDLDFDVEGEVGGGAVAILGRARRGNGLVGHVEISRRGKARDQALPLHVAVVAGFLLVGHFALDVSCGQRLGRGVEARTLRLDDVAVARCTARKAGEIGARVVHGERVDHEGVRACVEAGDRAHDLKR